MNGAESVVRSLLSAGVDTCFANPGTSEMHFVAALDRVPGMRCVLGLFEGVVTGAADGYARMTGRPAVTLMHCGPGMAYGLANMHNARRAASPMINIIGDQATYHRPLDPPLAADTEGLARPASDWLRTAIHVETLGADAAAAIEAARAAPGRIATLIVPSDLSWSEGGCPAAAEPPRPPALVGDATIRQIADVLRGPGKALLLLTGAALNERALPVAQRIGAATGAELMADHANGRFVRGRGRVPIKRIAWATDLAVAQLADVNHLILVGTQEPVAFFAHPGKPSRLAPPDCAIHTLSRPDENPVDALQRVAEALNALTIGRPGSTFADSSPPSGAVTPESLAAMLVAAIPENAIVVDEGVSFGRALFARTQDAAPHDWLHQTGGAMGCGMPLAAGAAIGAPGRRVITIQADGAAMYTPQALWTQARERLDVTTIILANRKYAVLYGELQRVGASAGATAERLLDLTDPELDFVKLAHTFGVEAARATTIEAAADLLRASIARAGPFLIELMIA